MLGCDLSVLLCLAVRRITAATKHHAIDDASHSSPCLMSQVHSPIPARGPKKGTDYQAIKSNLFMLSRQHHHLGSETGLPAISVSHIPAHAVPCVGASRRDATNQSKDYTTMQHATSEES